MKVLYRKLDILNVPQGYYLAHAISADLTLGAGVAKQLDRVYDLKSKLSRWHVNPEVGECLTVDNVFNLVDKKSRYDTVEDDDLITCFESMRNTAVALGVKKIALPKIGCGCDNLRWSAVEDMLLETFRETDIELLICVLSDDELEDDFDSADLEDEEGYLTLNNDKDYTKWFDENAFPDNDVSTDDDEWIDISEEDLVNEIACVYITSEDLTAKSNDNTIIGIKVGEVDIEEASQEYGNGEVLIGIDTYNRDEAVRYKFLFKTDESYVLKKV